MKNLEKKKQDLEEVLTANIIVPDMSSFVAEQGKSYGTLIALIDLISLITLKNPNHPTHI